MEDRLGQRLLIVKGQADQLRFLDRSPGGLLGGGDDEVADAAALEFGGAFDHIKNFRSDARFEAGGTMRFLRQHGAIL
jgi:hypothetical protein